MVQSAEDRLSGERAEALDRLMARRILPQGQMRSEFIVVAGVDSSRKPTVGMIRKSIAPMPDAWF